MKAMQVKGTEIELVQQNWDPQPEMNIGQNQIENKLKTNVWSGYLLEELQIKWIQQGFILVRHSQNIKSN